MVAGLVAGAQVTCILLVPSMLAWTCFHYSAGGIPHAVLNFALTAAVVYFGFVPFPTVPPFELTPAAIWMTIISFLTVLPGLIYLVGGKTTDSMYEKMPHLKEQFLDDPEGLLSDMDSGGEVKSYKRARELAQGAHLLGAGCCMAAATVSGGAFDLCLLSALPMTANGYCHWLRREEHESEKNGAIFCWVLAAVTLGFGIVRVGE